MHVFEFPPIVQYPLLQLESQLTQILLELGSIDYLNFVIFYYEKYIILYFIFRLN